MYWAHLIGVGNQRKANGWDLEEGKENRIVESSRQEKLEKPMRRDTEGLLEAGKGRCFLGGCFVHFASLSNDFWLAIKRFCLNCLCGCLGSGWSSWAEECVDQPYVSAWPLAWLHWRMILLSSSFWKYFPPFPDFLLFVTGLLLSFPGNLSLDGRMLEKNWQSLVLACSSRHPRFRVREQLSSHRVF